MTKQEISEKQFKQLFKAQAKKIVFFIEALNATKEERQAFYVLIKDMSLEQIDRLVSILESRYLDEMTKSEDNKLIEHIKKVKEKLDFQKTNLEKESINKIQNLSCKLKDF